MARCGSCGKGKQRPLGFKDSTSAKTESFALLTPDGKKRQYGSELERDAAHVRLGGRIIK